MARRYGYIKKDEALNKVLISNKIFEIRIGNYFMSKALTKIKTETSLILHQDVIKHNTFDMELAMRKFGEHYSEIFSDNDEAFLERHGRLIFLSYLKPLINGQGFYHIESQFTDLRRMDVVLDFGNDQFIIELKLWKGEAAKEQAYERLAGYMSSRNADKGYLLTFDFRKNRSKGYSAEWVRVGDRMIFDVVV
jgi:hypothetical protein